MKHITHFLFISSLALTSLSPVSAQKPATQSAPEKQSLAGPDQQFGKLFEDVQLKAIFPDSKTFADCTPKLAPARILAAYEKARVRRDFDLKAFVAENFALPVTPASGYTSKASQSARQHLIDLWPVLTRPADTRSKGTGQMGSLIPLTKPYIVPGGRFGEIYYWDSYFTMLGLQASNRMPQIRNMVDNFAYLINTFGFIPNGNRTYFLGRSQPPFFSLMVNLLSEKQEREVLLQYLPSLQKEYNFWMDGKATLTPQKPAYRRVVQLASGVYLNRYYDDKDTPRPESYKEDVRLARNTNDPKTLYRHIRAGAESGWDFSSRWFRDGKNLRTIHTTDFIPVDLNCLLVNLERTLADGYRLKGDQAQATLYQQLAQQRSDAILRYCWNAKRQFFFDYDFVAQQPAAVYSLAAAFPLFMNIATPEQAKAVGQILKKDFLKPGGLTTTLVRTGEQWDSPNGWAPLQWMAIQGLRNYKQTELANQIKLNWVTENLRVYKASGKMVEKYDVISTASAKGGEYPNQDGFGWTNGVLLRLLNEE
ncbi:alpha,alpha-trehalase TreF [Spirosoma utsteinense]|uniref:Alpha,alpha-trehalase n=1 Tax=Spirosoma utsteinense TaxID=2585773 RepID=A0ABR6WCK1_9BACT|nr:alpha,alpha-trehalase TreF [Spirosoma utsteinense]MBC3788342.1 alpha,alpha-trehalase [Spirosoma utsteinense]MBC3794259.1 alpha,alpha-trehalase [Spirosoma utsteinense]